MASYQPRIPTPPRIMKTVVIFLRSLCVLKDGEVIQNSPIKDTYPFPPLFRYVFANIFKLCKEKFRLCLFFYCIDKQNLVTTCLAICQWRSVNCVLLYPSFGVSNNI